MDLLVLLALLLLGGLSVFIRRSSSSPRRALAPAPPAVHKISDPGVAHRVLVAFSDRPFLPFFVELAKRHAGRRNDNVGTAAYGPLWHALRRNMTAETFHPSRLAQLAPLQREAIQGLVAALQSAGGAAAACRVEVDNLRDHLRAALFRLVARMCFGDGTVDERRLPALCSQVQGLLDAIGVVKPFAGTSLLARLAERRYQGRLLAFHARFTQLCLPIIAARRGRLVRGDGLCRPYIDALIDLRVPQQAEEGGEDVDGGGRRALSDEEMVSLMLEFLGAGMMSQAACLEWTLAHLVADPEAQEKLRREVVEAAVDGEGPDSIQQLTRGMPYLHAVLLESLRMHPPAPMAFRHVQADAASTVMGEGGAESDVVVLFLLGDMGRDAKAWKDPDEFRPERFLAGGDAEGVGPLPGGKETRMLPFGAGHRHCPGMAFAMANIKCFLAALVREFEWAPPTNAAVDFTELDGFLKTMQKPLAARLTRRTPSSV